MRDIRGISNACATKQHFLLLFEWCYPNVFNIMYYVVEKWPNDPNVREAVFFPSSKIIIIVWYFALEKSVVRNGWNLENFIEQTSPRIENAQARNRQVLITNFQVVTPVCRLLAEMSQNKQQRLKFEMNSCSAVLLFKEISKIVTKLGNYFIAWSLFSENSISCRREHFAYARRPEGPHLQRRLQEHRHNLFRDQERSSRAVYSFR